jgi:homoserine dehydrogenase
LFEFSTYDSILHTLSAKDVVFGAIHAGKHVVTANKALIAAFLPELQASLAANPTVR